MEFLDLFLHLDVVLKDMVTTYGIWIYVILFLVIFCETGLVVTPFLPGDSLLFVAGMIAASGALNVHLLFLILLVAAVLGDAINYTIGKYFGHKLFANKESKIFRPEYLTKTHDFFEKYGGKTIIIARFVPIVRTFAPFVAGMAAMTYRKFAFYNVTGALLWVGSLLYAGYLLGGITFIQKNLTAIILGIIFISILPGIIEVAKHKLSKVKA
ncbi:DedA family protein [Deefgea chitinilytica]|uniref:DedA family protein n=2 Tax=Chitinibacteraceae TaxID=2897177 RepID=A0ABS2C9D5_9NEIS|nr:MULTISPECIES: DedA family protein [Deefgea]MBM5570766.1 DedA family protein [Deefgea chitinilytica]MBM9887995.1 DedA family protein [Deefgea sp. CFH1-16]